MKITADLRRIIESRFPAHSFRRVKDGEFQKYLKQAAEKKPELAKMLESLEDAKKTIAKVKDRLEPWGIRVDDDGDVRLDDEDLFEKLVKLPPLQVTRGDVIHKLAGLSPGDGIAYLKTVGIDWS